MNDTVDRHLERNDVPPPDDAAAQVVERWGRGVITTLRKGIVELRKANQHKEASGVARALVAVEKVFGPGGLVYDPLESAVSRSLAAEGKM